MVRCGRGITAPVDDGPKKKSSTNRNQSDRATENRTEMGRLVAIAQLSRSSAPKIGLDEQLMDEIERLAGMVKFQESAARSGQSLLKCAGLVLTKSNCEQLERRRPSQRAEVGQAVSAAFVGDVRDHRAATLAKHPRRAVDDTTQ